MKSLRELVNNLGCGHHRDHQMRIAGLWGYTVHALCFVLSTSPWWFACMPEVQHHRPPGHTILRKAEQILISIITSRVPTVLTWVGFRTPSAHSLSPVHGSATPPPLWLRLCLLTHHLHCAARSLAGFWCLTPYHCPATLSLPSTPDRAWHCSTYPGDV